MYPYGVPIEEQHPITARRFKQKQPLEFMTQIRPETETASQALRMLGTYPGDAAHAERLGIFIPQVSPLTCLVVDASLIDEARAA
jgi:hypothetical protein